MALIPSNENRMPSDIQSGWTVKRYNIREVKFHDGVCYTNVEVDVNKPNPYPYSSIVVGVFGSAYQGSTSQCQVEKEKSDWVKIAYELGEKIALFNKKNMVLLNGACPGLPHYAAKGAATRGGFVAGISAADGSRLHHKIVGEELASEQKWTHNIILYPNLTYDLSTDGRLLRDQVIDRLKWRNPMNTEFSDICIALEGSYGSLFEISMALHPNYSIVGVLTSNAKKTFREIEESGEWHFGDFIHLFHEKIGKKKNGETIIIPSDDPQDLVNQLFEAWAGRQKRFSENQEMYHPSMKRPFETKIIEPLEKVMGRNP
jgi:predicted Rossmann-fold nucleotide-binding protein